ncbi:MAG TPA: LutB/LldF family L-lactate oxidation iron-sulfur protein [Stellaceae bacterium]|nr:LutB/LldF family L-lactate oxidation iron-sulfur protein [Stellaceae bacterium]
MEAKSRDFSASARAGLANDNLQQALDIMTQRGFPSRRLEVVARLPEFEALREVGREIKDHTLAHLDFYLELYEHNVVASGGEVHWARTPEEACEIVLTVCRTAGARSVTKGKSMIAEEIGLNDFLEKSGITPVETDLGEYIIQLRHEPPSHLIAPAMHLVKEQVADAFRSAHRTLDPNRPLAEPQALCDEARAILRPQFLAADVGITGANFLIAETGSSIIVTNEGNGDLTQILPRVHIVLASLEKLVPTFEDAATLLRLLARSATGQEFSSYTTVSTGPRRPGDLDGPEAYHVILLDNGRAAMLGGEFHDMLRCIRCGACMNHCPVYAAVGGHAYGWVYPGPMGAVLTPSLIGIEEAAPLPNASTLCGRCESVCPVKIPLPKMLRHWREREFAKKLAPRIWRSGLSVWAWVALRPALYHMLTEVASRTLGWVGGRRGRFRNLPFAAGWTGVRDMPAPEGRSFHSLWAERSKAAGRK